MKILFVNPPNKPFTEKHILIEPIDILSLASLCISLGHEASFFDMDAKRLGLMDLIKQVQENQFDKAVIVFDNHIPLHKDETLNTIKKINKILHEQKIEIIGIGKTFTYNHDLIKKLNIDVSILEGKNTENTLTRLLNLQNLFSENLSKISGIIFVDNGVVVTNPPTNEEFDINDLPITCRDLVDKSDYIDIKSMITSRGCINNCKFCPCKNFWGNWKGKSPELVVNEIKDLVENFGTKKIIFLDDNATVDNQRMIDICNLIKKEKTAIKLGCLCSVNTFNKEMFVSMAQAGFRWVHFGIESGCQEVLEHCGKNFDVQKAVEIINFTKKLGLRVRTSLILDLEPITEKNLQDTLGFIEKTMPDEIRIHYLVNRLGSEYGKNNGQISNQYIHENKIVLQNEKSDLVLKYVNILTRMVKNNDYSIIKKPSQWADIEKLRGKDGKIKFVSFCPSKYGIDW
ncbi:MAG: radical SAM protein [Clostridia bacterium]